MATTTLTNSEWARLDRLFKDSFIAYADFLIDGYKVHMIQKLVGRKLDICCYVNGEVRGEWFTKDNEIVNRFFPFSTLDKYRPQFKTRLKKVFNKKELSTRFPDLDDKIKRPRLTFKNIAEVRRVFEANNDCITLLN